MVVASLAGFAALDLSSRVAAAAGASRLRWIAASAIAMGVGIWSMHFVAMLALRMAVPVTYDVTLLVLSVAIAISASAITFTTASTSHVSLGRLAVASLAMGPAIAGMHYTGMAAMRMPARIDYNVALVTLSVLIAITASFAALVLARHFRGGVRNIGWLKAAAAVPMGAAVYGMHYAGMLAARFYPAGVPTESSTDVIASETLAWAVAAGAVVVLSLVILAALADRRLDAARATNAAILEVALDCIITMDERGMVLEFNPAAERTFGYTRAQARGKPLADLIIPEELRPAHWAGLQRYRATGEGPILGKRLELRAQRADGQLIDVEVAITRIPVGDPPVFTGFLRDITERKRMDETARQHAEELHRASLEAEAALREAELANRAKSEFLAAMSHELRTPLNAIAGYTQLMDEGLAGSVTPRQREYLAAVRRSQQLLLSLINDVLNFAKLEAGHVDLRVEDVAVDDALQTVASMIQPLALKKGLDFSYSGGDPALALRTDRDKLIQVVLNLTSNAVKFTDPGGTVALRWGAADGEVRIAVSDSGIGIPADRLHDVFEPFVQVNRDSGGTAQGTGLGLAISRDLARVMGGDLSVKSAPGEGSTFTFSLPRDAAPDSG
ncbi:hypothetical protein BH23GEM2_BH23GEM2_18410 [soil metagenome]